MHSTKLEKLHEFSGSKSDYKTVKRRFKSDLKKRLQDWEVKNYIEPGLRLGPNADGHEIAYGVRTKSRLEVLSPSHFVEAEELDDGMTEYAEFAQAENQ